MGDFVSGDFVPTPTRHYYQEIDNGGMTYAEAQTKCTGKLGMARFYTQAEFNLIEELVGKCFTNF